jgi:hypothetical protein
LGKNVGETTIIPGEDQIVEEGDTGFGHPTSTKDIEDAEVLIKSAEIDISEAEKTGADLSEAKMLLQEAKSHLNQRNIKLVKISVKKAQTAAADAKRFHRADLLIRHALPVVEDAKRAGADIRVADSFIEQAKESLRNRMYGEVSEYVRSAKREAKEAKRYHRAFLMIENCKNDIANAQMAGGDITEAEAFLSEAKSALEQRDYGVVAQLVKNAKNAATHLQKHKKVEELINGVKPEVDEIKRLGLEIEEIEALIAEAEQALNRTDYAEVRSLVRKIKRKVKRAMERKGANVLIATIDHVIHKAQAKGLDVRDLQVLFERAKRAMERMDHPEIERIIQELNTVASSMGISIGSLAGDLFSKAKLVDLEKIDLVFSEAERKISAEMARARIITMRDLMTSAKELGIDGVEFISLLNKAEEAFEAKDFDIIEEYKEAFEDKLEEAKLRHKIEIVGKKIDVARKVIAQYKGKGVDVKEPEDLISIAMQALDSQNFDSAEQHANLAQKSANEQYRKYDTEQKLGSVKDILSEAVESGIDVSEITHLLSQAETQIQKGDFNSASELIAKAKGETSDNIQKFIVGKAPRFSVDLPKEGMEADVWNKCHIEITNTGDLAAKNVDLRFKGDMEVRGVEKIEKLTAGEKKRMEIGVKPKEAGELDMEVLLKYQRAFDDTVYQLDLAKSIIADTYGTYMIEEVLLIHNSGILISQATRKMDMEVDRDIFSGMFTAVQDFIKDSFQRRDDSGLKRMDFGENKIVIEHGHKIFLTAITVGGEPRYLPLFMAETMREVEEKYGEQLENWRGDHSKLEGIDSIIEKLLQVSDEKGADVAGFERGVVASTIRLIEAAEEAGVMVGGHDAFLEEFAQTMQKNGFDFAWDLLENKEKSVDREINIGQAKKKILAMKDLLSSAKEWGMSAEESQALINQAESALAQDNFEVIEQYKDSFEQKLQDAKRKQRTDIIERRIKNAMVLVSQFKEMGIDVEKPMELLALADSEFSANKFAEAEEHVDEAEQIADEMRQKHDIEIELKSIRETTGEVKEIGGEVDDLNELLTQAESELNANNMKKAQEIMESTRRIIAAKTQGLIEGKYPKFTMKLPAEGLEADFWNKCIIEISNIGDIAARNININIGGGVDVIGVDMIDRLNSGELQPIEIGIKPKQEGKLNMEVQLTYQRIFDDTIYQLNIGKRIIAEASGTFSIEEVLLIHESGILISTASRKLETGMDRDIFSGMFTAVQDFIKDSFQANEEAGLKRMDFGDNKILIEHGHNIFLTAILTGGEPRYLPLYMVEVINELEQNYGEVLVGWRGDLGLLEGIDDYLVKLLHVTDEKGAEVAGFESGLVAQTIKLIEEAEEAGFDVKGHENLVEEFVENMEKGGFTRAWAFLENMGLEVNKEINVETAREKISAMRALISATKEWGMSEDEFISLIKEAESALESGNFDAIDEHKANFEKKLDEAKLKQKTDIILRRIKNAMVVISQFKQKGIDVSQPQELVMMADSEFKAKEYESAKEHVDQAEKLAEALRKKHDIKVELESLKMTLKDVRDMKIEVEDAIELLTLAEFEIEGDNLTKAQGLIEKARTLTNEKVTGYIEGKFPRFSLDVPNKGLEADYWNKCVLEIDNTGDLAAKNIDIEFQGDVEIKGIDRIERLNAGEKRRMEIGLKPLKSGVLNTDVQLTYQRAFDDTVYQLKLGKRINIDETGTYSIENIFLIHNKGVLILNVSRILDAEVDSDIFSGMLTALQDFIKDSFKRMEDVGLKRMDFGPNKLMIERGNFTYLAAVLTGGEPKFLPLYMLEVINELEQKYGNVLKEWDGTYTQLKGLDEIIMKLMQVTDEKGADVEGFESGRVASTIKLIQAASAEGMDIDAPEAFANTLVEVIEREGFEKAWRYLEKMGQEVEETSLEYRTKKEGMEELKDAFLTDVEEHVIRDLGDSLENYLTIIDSIIVTISEMKKDSEFNDANPVRTVVIKSADEEVRDALTKLRIPFQKKAMTKDLKILDQNMEWEGLDLQLVPQMNIINRVYKQQASKVMTLLRYQSPWKIKESIEKEGEYTLGVEGYPVKITQAMLEFKLSIPDNVIKMDFDKGTIYMDIEVTQEMKTEGLAGELIKQINDMRSELNLKEEDYIETQVFVPDKTAEILEGQKELIAKKTRSYAIEFPFDNIFESGDLGYYVSEREVGGEKAVIGIVLVEWDDS